MKILFLVLDTFASEYQVLKQAQLNTWVKDANLMGHRAIFYRGNLNSETLLKDHTLTVKAGDSLSNSACKLTFAIEYCLEEFKGYDFVYRTNLSSYIDVKMMEEHLAAPSTNLDTLAYAGVVGYYSKPISLRHKLLSRILRPLHLSVKFRLIRFASGSGIFLAWKTCELIIKNKKHINFKLIDDVAIGKLLSLCGIYPSSLPRIDILDDFNENQGDSISFPRDTDIFHFRIKGASRIKDAIAMHWLHSQPNKLDALRTLMCTADM